MKLCAVRLFLLFQIQLLKISNCDENFCTLPDRTESQKHKILNDDFCDCSNGLDEIKTAACSFRSKRIYSCPSKYVGINVTIPLSRLQDGICDCCDGSDEIGFLGYSSMISKEQISGTFLGISNHCEDTCEDDLLFMKQKSLIFHKNLKDGLTAKKKIIAAYELKKKKENKSHEGLKTEKTKIEEYLSIMKYYIIIELKLEESKRFELLRERADKCAKGNLLYCDLFTIEYHDINEVLDNNNDNNDNNNDNYINGINNNDNNNNNNNNNDINNYYNNNNNDDNDKNRIHNRHSQSKIKSHAQKEEKENLNTLNGMQKIKSVTCESEHLLPDESPRIFVILSDYIDYVQKNSLYDKKKILAAKIVICEFVGLTFSPIIIVSNLFFSSISTSIELLNDNITLYYDMEVKESFNSYNIFSYLYYIYIDNQKYDTMLFKNFFFLNPYRYSFFLSFLDSCYYYFETSKYLFNLAIQSPDMYYDYYINNKNELLPESRHSCLLRSGIETAENELKVINIKINDEEIKILNKNNNEKKNNKKEKKIARDKKRNENKKNDKNDNNLALNNVDFGPSDSWESMKNICLEEVFGEYKYNFCFFGKFKQDDTLLGVFKKWGNLNKKKDNNYDNINEFNNDMKTNINSEVEKEVENENEDDNVEEGWLSFGQKKMVKIKTNEEQNLRSKFQYQIYDDGTVCQVGAAVDGMRARRKASISFLCGPTSRIVNVLEKEICVYDAIIETPLVCLEEMESESYERLKLLDV